MRLRWMIALLLGLTIVPMLRGVESNWQALARIQPGDKIQVVDQQLKSYTGKFVGFSESGITLQTTDKEITVPKEDVYRVTIVSRGRGRHVLRALLIGGGVGLAIGAGVSAPDYAKGARGEAIATSAAMGAGIGALIGAAKTPHIPTYRAERIVKK